MRDIPLGRTLHIAPLIVTFRAEDKMGFYHPNETFDKLSKN